MADYQYLTVQAGLWPGRLPGMPQVLKVESVSDPDERQHFPDDCRVPFDEALKELEARHWEPIFPTWGEPANYRFRRWTADAEDYADTSDSERRPIGFRIPNHEDT